MNDAYAIRLAKTELREGYNTGKAEQVVSVYGDVFSDMSAGCSSFYGGEAKAVFRHRLTELFANYRAHLAVTIISIGIEGSMAFDWGWHTLTLTPKSGGRPKTIRTRYLEIWKKQPDGPWKIAIFFDNLDRPPAMPPKEVTRSLFATGSRGGTTTRERRRKSSRTAAS